MRVTEPLEPKHSWSPSGPVMHFPVPPLPASATYSAPWPSNASPRGLFSPVATTVKVGRAVLAGVVVVLPVAAPALEAAVALSATSAPAATRTPRTRLGRDGLLNSSSRMFSRPQPVQPDKAPRACSRRGSKCHRLGSQAS